MSNIDSIFNHSVMYDTTYPENRLFGVVLVDDSVSSDVKSIQNRSNEIDSYVQAGTDLANNLTKLYQLKTESESLMQSYQTQYQISYNEVEKAKIERDIKALDVTIAQIEANIRIAEIATSSTNTTTLVKGGVAIAALVAVGALIYSISKK